VEASAAAALGLTRPPTLAHICATCYKVSPVPGTAQARALGEISDHRDAGYEAIPSSNTPLPTPSRRHG
jgi:hypothetical protein